MVDSMKHVMEESKEYVNNKISQLASSIQSGSNNHVLPPTTDYIYEYNSNVRPPHRPVPIRSFSCEQHYLDNQNTTTADIPWDLSMEQDLDIDGKAVCSHNIYSYHL